VSREKPKKDKMRVKKARLYSIFTGSTQGGIREFCQTAQKIEKKKQVINTEALAPDAAGKSDRTGRRR